MGSRSFPGHWVTVSTTIFITVALFALPLQNGAAFAQPPAQQTPATHVPSPTPTPAASPPAPTYTRRINLGFAFLGDYTWFWQDQTNLNQVGEQHDQAQLRAARVILASNFSPAVNWYVAANYNGLDRTPDEPLFGLYDMYIGFPIKSIGRLQIGKQKETYGYEMVALAANLPSLERVILPFYQSRSWGVDLSNTALNKHMTWAAGLYEIDKSSNQASARLTAVPLLSANRQNYLHFGADYRYRGASNGLLRFQGKPQSDIASFYVDTGNFPGKYANELNYEFLATHGGLTFLSEYSRAWVNAPEVGNPNFYGYYFVGSWVLTGENRPYDTNAGYATRIIPTKPSGAYEFVVQYSRVNLSDAGVSGGTQGLGWVGFNWWQTPYWKYSLGYGTAGLTRFDSFGQMHRIQLRIQYLH
ncbi:MAG: hypothetical protein JOZ50_05035 [Candidatus Eremiobacteraeota bacterium]|nr:hypothetical protein [Candidatus Eremiobacteraeota bacterium]